MWRLLSEGGVSSALEALAVGNLRREVQAQAEMVLGVLFLMVFHAGRSVAAWHSERDLVSSDLVYTSPFGVRKIQREPRIAFSLLFSPPETKTLDIRQEPNHPPKKGLTVEPGSITSYQNGEGGGWRVNKAPHCFSKTCSPAGYFPESQFLCLKCHCFLSHVSAKQKPQTVRLFDCFCIDTP